MPATEPFLTPVDVANRALQHCGARRITTFADDSANAEAVQFVYDKVRTAELRRNVWRFAIRRAVLHPINTPLDPTSMPTAPLSITQSLPSMVLVPPAWDAGVEYDFGAIATTSDGQVWLNIQPANTGQAPGGAGVTTWDTYFGSMCVQPYDTTGSTAYLAGDLVYTSPGDGTTQVFKSLVGANAVDPRTAADWGLTIAYAKGQPVMQDGFYFESTFNLNIGNQPGVYGAWDNAITYAIGDVVAASDRFLYTALLVNTGADPTVSPSDWSKGNRRGTWPLWNDSTTYAAGDEVAAVDGLVYRSATSNNIGHDPQSDTTNWGATGRKNPWTYAFSGTTGSLQWVNLDADVASIDLTYPIGAGPSCQSETRNVFMLPNGFLREAPQDPKAGSNSILGAPTGLQYNDWNLEGNYITSSRASPIALRFVANVTLVTSMDPMFCEGLGARIAVEVVEDLTQSADKKRGIENAYQKFMTEARMVNGIETGSTEPPEDDYITCRQ